MQTPRLMQNPFWWHNHSFPCPQNIHSHFRTCSHLMYNFIWSRIECNCTEEKNIVMKVDQNHYPEPLLHLFCCPKIQEKGIELRIHINTVSGYYYIDSWRRRGGMDEIVLAAPAQVKPPNTRQGVTVMQNCIPAAQSLYISLQIKILTYSCNPRECISNIKI